MHTANKTYGVEMTEHTHGGRTLPSNPGPVNCATSPTSQDKLDAIQDALDTNQALTKQLVEKTLHGLDRPTDTDVQYQKKSSTHTIDTHSGAVVPVASHGNDHPKEGSSL
jgi:hypothetical protein